MPDQWEIRPRGHSIRAARSPRAHRRARCGHLLRLGHRVGFHPQRHLLPRHLDNLGHRDSAHARAMLLHPPQAGGGRDVFPLVLDLRLHRLPLPPLLGHLRNLPGQPQSDLSRSCRARNDPGLHRRAPWAGLCPGDPVGLRHRAAVARTAGLHVDSAVHRVRTRAGVRDDRSASSCT